MGRDLMESDYHFLGDWALSASAKDRAARCSVARTDLSQIGSNAEQP
jgi:hypothetical protein